MFKFIFRNTNSRIQLINFFHTNFPKHILIYETESRNRSVYFGCWNNRGERWLYVRISRGRLLDWIFKGTVMLRPRRKAAAAPCKRNPLRVLYFFYFFLRARGQTRARRRTARGCIWIGCKARRTCVMEGESCIRRVCIEPSLYLPLEGSSCARVRASAGKRTAHSAATHGSPFFLIVSFGMGFIVWNHRRILLNPPDVIFTIFIELDD